MKNISASVVIPFRDRGTDPRRGANLDVVMGWWWLHGIEPLIQSDGLDGDSPFNRHRAYNRAVSGNSKDNVFVFVEADMILPAAQLDSAIYQAYETPGLVVPFTQYRYLSDDMTAGVREEWHIDRGGYNPMFTESQIFELEPESVMSNGKSIGAVNVVSRETLELTGGFTEATSGNWYDDNIIEEGFAYLTSPTRWVNGPAVHLYHLPGWMGDHLSEEDRLATQRNKDILNIMRGDIKHGVTEEVRNLMSYRKVMAR